MKTLAGLSRRFFLLVGNALPRTYFFNKHRSRLYRLAGLHIGCNVTVLGPLKLELDPEADNTGNVSIGDGTYVNAETWLNCRDDKVTIGKNVLVGPRVAFETATHGLRHDAKIGRSRATKPIIVEDNVWIGAGATILLGVTVHEGAVVAAGALVVKDVEPFTLVGGVPARKIKDIDRAKLCAPVLSAA